MAKKYLFLKFSLRLTALYLNNNNNVEAKSVFSFKPSVYKYNHNNLRHKNRSSPQVPRQTVYHTSLYSHGRQTVKCDICDNKPDTDMVMTDEGREQGSMSKVTLELLT